jgi:hypothetical protein
MLHLREGEETSGSGDQGLVPVAIAKVTARRYLHWPVAVEGTFEETVLRMLWIIGAWVLRDGTVQRRMMAWAWAV